MSILNETLEHIGINLNNWMCPKHCTPDEWVRTWMIVFGTYISVVYSLFAYKVLFSLRVPLKNLIHKKFPVILGVIFLLCALVHLSHSWAYLHQYWKLIALFFYPLLAFFHTKLLTIANESIRNMGNLKTVEDIKEIKDENTRLKLEKKQLLDHITESYKTKDFESLKNYLNG